ncbi:hypothetical protein BSCG_00464 [Bacteroides sp. 2_2_4]|nr:hypothetical protein BSCG_00464 [Bacteroides sp. 2_2_4]
MLDILRIKKRKRKYSFLNIPASFIFYPNITTTIFLRRYIIGFLYQKIEDPCI